MWHVPIQSYDASSRKTQRVLSVTPKLFFFGDAVKRLKPKLALNQNVEFVQVVKCIIARVFLSTPELAQKADRENCLR